MEALMGRSGYTIENLLNLLNFRPVRLTHYLNACLQISKLL